MMYDKVLEEIKGLIPEANSNGQYYTANMLEKAANAIEELSKRVDESIPKDDAEIIIAEVAKPRWIPVTERLPKEEKEIYWCYTNMGIMCECRWTNNRWGLGESDKWGWNIMDVPQYQKVTHWMPLPEPPKE